MSTQLLKSAQLEQIWNQYLAGFIDGDGSLLMSKAGYASLEITMDIHDLHALNLVKQRLGGSVKRRSSSQSYRYRLHHKAGMLYLLSRVNSKIRQSNRMVQLQKMCVLYNLPFKSPEPLTLKNAWFAGFFDAAGTVGFSFKRGWPQLTIRVSQKSPSDLLCFQRFFGGAVRLDSASNTWKWHIYSEQAVYDFYQYCKRVPLHSRKKKRMFLLPTFFQFKKVRASSSNDPSLKKAWALFEKNWNTFSMFNTLTSLNISLKAQALVQKLGESSILALFFEHKQKSVTHLS